MWGTLFSDGYCFDRVRFIPTHVGNSVEPGPPIPNPTVHPHACGELCLVAGSSRASLGSSPRMWGTLHAAGSGAGRVRFIPTHVGNSPCVVSGLCDVPVHPHACGELGLVRCNVIILPGSSPRMWGTHRVALLVRPFDRFIPTHVGNSDRSGETHTHCPVHPHACGELTTSAAL